MSDNHQELKALKEQIEAFIKEKNPEIFALTGTWGVGKTFALKNVIAELKKENDTQKHLGNYAYVSLFGLKDIKDIKFKIIGSLSEFTKNTSKMVNGFAKGFKLDGLSNIFTDLGESMFIDNRLKNKIICFDDFERTSIDTQELLGFLQDLKEERNCKIILIYNEEKLENERKKDFDTYREKVIDKHFDYTPSPSETVVLAFRGAKNENPFANIQDYQAFIAEKCEALKLNNIRIIQKFLKHISRDIQPILDKVSWSRDIYPDIQKDVTEHIISVIILYAFLYFQGDYEENNLKISKEDFEQNFNLAQFEKHYAKIDVLSLYDDQFDEGFEEKQKKEQMVFQDFHDKRVCIQNFIGADFDFHFSTECKSEIQAISNHIIQLIKAGYLLENQKSDLKENLEKI